MRDDLLGYYERELAFLRQMGGDFAKKYPKIASRLALDSDKCEDPHVERMIEAVALLTGRLRLKIDDEFPEVTESLLNVLYPHYLAPIPSMSIVQFALDAERGKLSTGYVVDKGTYLQSSAVDGTHCRFRTCYQTVLWPIDVEAASLTAPAPADSSGRWKEAVLRLKLRSQNQTSFSDLKSLSDSSVKQIDSLRFFIDGEPQLANFIYELIFNHVSRIELIGEATEDGKPTGRRVNISLPGSSLVQVGFGPDEGMLPYTPRSFIGYRLLTEYFSFPDKFLFFDLNGISKAANAGLGPELEILIHLNDVVPPKSTVDASNFKLGCAPIVNLFTKIAEPLSLTHRQHEYQVIPDVHSRMGTEVYSIDSITAGDLTTKQFRKFEPFYSYSHARQENEDETFWYASRRASSRAEDSGTEVFLTLVDLGFNPSALSDQTVIIHVTCTNRDLPSKLPFGGREGELEIEGAAPLSRVRCLKKPSPTLRLPMRRGAQWRLISHLSLNHLSLVEGENALDSLKEILSLYDFSDSSATRKQIRGITGVSSRRVVRQVGQRIGAGFVRGLETRVEFDEENFVGSGIFLFACVLERFLGLYASVNSFSQMVAATQQREGYLKRWPARTGEAIVQ